MFIYLISVLDPQKLETRNNETDVLLVSLVLLYNFEDGNETESIGHLFSILL